MAGCIKLFRQFREWEWYQDEHVKSVFIELLLTANYKVSRWKGRTIERGQLVTSLGSLQIALGLSIQEIRTALEKLESTGEITKESTNKFSIITICNFDKWQTMNREEQQTNNKQITSQQQTSNNQITNEQQSNNNTLISKESNKEINNITHTTHVCAHEGESEKWFAQMKRQFTAWQADACRVLRIDQETLATYIEDFEVECRAKNATHVSWEDITSHFIDWARRQVEKQQIKQQKNYGNQAKYDPTDSYEPKSTRENYFL